jgi:predicted nucleic acid-binding protein
MRKVFVDSDVLLDVLAKRMPFYADSAAILTLAERKLIRAFTTPIVIANIFYILGRMQSKLAARENIRKLRLFIKILPVTEDDIDKALASRFNDFEDAIQYFASMNNNVEFMITRNQGGFKGSKISVYNPAEFLKAYHLQGNE